MEKKPITPLTAGIIISLSSIILFLGYYFTGLVFQQSWYAWIPAIIFVGLLIIFISTWSNAQNNFVTFGSCFGFGFRVVCITTLIVFLFTFLFIYLTPEYKGQMLQMMKDQMRSNKNATDEQVEKGMGWVADHFMLMTMGGSLFTNVLIGLIGSLIGAAVAKKKPFDPFTQVNQIGETQP